MNSKILFLDSAHPSLHRELEKLGCKCDLKYNLTEEEIKASIKNYEGLVIRSKIKLTKEIIDKATKLKFIARVGAGMENIDVAYAESKGVKCLHAPEGNRDAVAEHAIGMLLALFNNICKANNEVRTGEWVREENRGVELSGKTVGIIGYGNMGSAFAQRLKGFDVKILAYDKYKKNYSDDFVIETTLDTIFEEADVVSMHVPLTDETMYMVNDSFIQKFRKNIYLVNTARGKVVKTNDLVKNMKSGKILGACLDVLEYEDISFTSLRGSEATEACLPDRQAISTNKKIAFPAKKRDRNDIPEAFQYLIKSSKVILTPHIAGWTHEANEKMARILVEKVKKLI